MDRTIQASEATLVIDKIKNAKASDALEARLYAISLEFLENHNGQPFLLKDFATFVEDRLFSPDFTDQKYVHWVAFGVGMGLGYAAAMYMF